jgi:hypothetical protein
MSTATCRCGKAVSDETRFTYQGETLCASCYLGPTERGPFAEQYIPCPKCGATLHRASIFCERCHVSIREIGRIESVARGSGTKGIGFVVGSLVLLMLAMVLGERAKTAGMPLGQVIALAASSVLLGVNGLLGLLYFRFFAGVTFVRGLLGFGLGALSFLLAAVLVFLLI